MYYLTKYIEKIIFLSGFFSALPFFFIPYKPFIYINKFYIDNIWNDKLTLYPGYTPSLGLSSPFILLFLTIFFSFSVFVYKNNEDKIRLIILGGCLVLANAIIIFLLSSSIKSLSASSSLIGLYMILALMNNIYFKSFNRGFLICLIIFINLHALSIILNGIKVSYSIHGTSIFGIEIYQSLVSYGLVVSFFLSTLILKKETFDNLFKFENKKFQNIIYFITLFSCIVIIVILARRLAFLILLLSLFIWFVAYIKNIKSRFFLHIFSILGIFFSILILLNKFFFTGARAINYTDMIQPRLNGVLYEINQLFYLKSKDFYFGNSKGWGNIENGFVNIFINTGVVGLLSYLFTFMFLIYFIYQKLDFLILKKNLPYIYFSLFVLLITNIVNNTFSTPYFFVSFFVILVNVLSKKDSKIIT